MPIKVMDGLPAREVLQNEGIFVMDESRAFHQDIRPLRILILNLMPIKQVTEVQLLRLLGNTPLQIDVSFIHTESYKSKNTAVEYLNTYYRTFTDVKNERFDGMIITGAPIEHLAFEDVSYWPELVEIMEWTKSNVTSTFHICWGAQAGLYYHYGVNKHPIDKKAFGIFPHYVLNKSLKLFRGFDDVFYVPHSRHTTIEAEVIEKAEGISIASVSDDAGVYIVISDDRKQIFVTGHSEYDPDSLKSEYERDIGKGLCIDMPKNYFMDNNPQNDPVVRWRSHANLLFSNWLNYYVYQETPYEISV